MSDSNGAQVGGLHGRGYRDAQDVLRARLAAILHGLVDTDDLPASTAREIMVAVHGLSASDAEFGPDPVVTRVVDRLWE